MKVTIKHGGGEASVRAAGLAVELREALDIEVVQEVAGDGILQIDLNGEPLVWRHGGPLEHAVGLGWPDAETVIPAIRAKLGPRSPDGNVAKLNSAH